jgi:hypothetical protein
MVGQGKERKHQPERAVVRQGRTGVVEVGNHLDARMTESWMKGTVLQDVLRWN